jgi:dienelactone hydrolase
MRTIGTAKGMMSLDVMGEEPTTQLMNKDNPQDRLTSDAFYAEVDRLIRVVGVEDMIRNDVFFRLSRADIAANIEYSELQRILKRIEDFKGWYDGWATSARKFADLGAKAERSGRRITAGDHYLRASMLYHFAQLFTRPEAPERREGRTKRVLFYRKACPLLIPTINPIEIDVDGLVVPGYFRPPVGDGPFPAVVMVPGANSVKEELHHWANAICARGVATLALDGPGQGELSPALDGPPLRFDTYPVATSAALDWLMNRPEIEPNGIAVWGQSTGGQLAIRAAVQDERYAAVISLSGPYDFRRELTALTPADVREEARDLHGFSSFQEAASYVQSSGSLSGLLSRLSVPLLIIHGGKDELVDDEEVELMVKETSGPVQTLLYPEGNHGVCNFNTEMTADMADWIAAELNSALVEANPRKEM